MNINKYAIQIKIICSLEFILNKMLSNHGLYLNQQQIHIQEVKSYLQFMNSNSPSTTDYQLRKAVEEQLDLILKMEQQRKALKKQNRLLHQKLKETNNMIFKYSKQTISAQTNTENNDQSNIKQETSTSETKPNAQKRKYQQIGIQIEIEIGNNNSSILARSKLDEAQSLLKVLDSYQSRVQLSNIVNAQDHKRNRSFNKQEKEKPQSIEKSKNNKVQHAKHDKQIANQMLKLTKELNTVKRQLKQSDHKYKLREKQINDLKKCLQTKNQALEKSRKQFNELSILMNSDKMKSVRNLQNQVKTLKSKLTEQEDGIKLKNLLQDLTKQYQQFRKETEKKIDILVSELAAKQKQVSFLQKQRKNSSRILQN